VRTPSKENPRKRHGLYREEAQGQTRKPLAAAQTDELMGYLRQNGKTLTADDCLIKPPEYPSKGKSG
jgi:hypothetical protein